MISFFFMHLMFYRFDTQEQQIAQIGSSDKDLILSNVGKLWAIEKY